MPIFSNASRYGIIVSSSFTFLSKNLDSANLIDSSNNLSISLYSLELSMFFATTKPTTKLSYYFPPIVLLIKTIGRTSN